MKRHAGNFQSTALRVAHEALKALLEGRKVTTARLILACALCAAACSGQSAQVSGLIQDSSAAKVANAAITVRNEATGSKRVTTSNASGYYGVFSLNPGTYRISVHASGFEAIVRDGIKLDVAENARLDFSLRIGDSHTEVTVHGGVQPINTEDASVGTVIDRDIIDQMPLNGRGIQALIELTPGVVVTPVVDSSRGQFAVNGQRADTNYFTVDGVSANFAAGNVQSNFGLNLSASGRASINQAGGGLLPANDFLGTFSNLVSPDALQEFRIETSTFAPEYGRSPGAQIGLITRAGTNIYSGSLFEYFRNDKADANDWFANYEGLPRAPLRFNDFGGTFGGPVRIPHLYNGHDRTFFFLSVEDLPMVLPQPPFASTVPTLEARQNAPPLVASLLNVYPLPNRSSSPDGSNPAVTGLGQFVGAQSLLQDQQTYGIRVDHTFSDRLMSFVRYNRAPSERVLGFAGADVFASDTEHYTVGTETLTAGFTHTLTPYVVNEMRINGSRQSANVSNHIDPFAGAKSPPDSLLFPAGYSSRDAEVIVFGSPLSGFAMGLRQENRARQLQFVDHLSWSKGTHSFKFGVDYRWFSPVQVQPRAAAVIFFNGLYGAQGIYTGSAASVSVITHDVASVAFVVKAFSSYAQDTWKINNKLTATYGLRWEVDPAPLVKSGRSGVLGGLSNLNDVSTAYLLPPGKPFYPTSWSNIAPRLGIAWQILDTSGGKTVLRAGAGRFFDLGQGGFEDSGISTTVISQYSNQPLGAIAAGPPEGVSSLGGGIDGAIAAATGYNVPLTYQWNVTLEQSIGQQIFSVGYVGALGRRLTQYVTLPVTNINVLGNNGSSSYQAMQLQFKRRLFGGIGLLLSYTWAHSLDTLSTDVEQFGVDVTIRSLTQYYNPNMNRGSSDFDIRHGLNGSLIAPLPSPRGGMRAILFRNWSASSIFFARSALPTDILSSNSMDRPDLVPGQPLYLYGSGYPGGKRYNDAAFSDPPAGAQGNLGRNVLRGFGAWQVDFALHRTFRLRERSSLQFRAEMFNILNHPNFANPGDLGDDPTHLTVVHNTSFGTSRSMLATGLSSAGVPGELNPLFQIGGPRSIQFALRLSF